MDIATNVIDFFLPRFCPSCKSKLTVKEQIACNSCFAAVKRFETRLHGGDLVYAFSKENTISDFLSLFIFEKDKAVQAILHELKYNGKFRTAIMLGEMLAKTHSSRIMEWNIDFIIPVPLHHLKRAERGYNQSFFIAKGIKKILMIRVESGLLKRKRLTESQTGLSISKRRENVKDAFMARHSKEINGKNILLIDDVITTGATLLECGRVLHEAGAAKVYAASIAVAEKAV